MKFGIVQGRLSPTIGNKLQNFPMHWKKEFKNLNKTGLSYIELFTNKKKFEPLLNKKGQKNLKDFLKICKLKYHVVCDNYLLNRDIYRVENINYILNLIEICQKINTKILIIPISKKNSYLTKHQKLLNYINKITVHAKTKKIILSFEFETRLNFLKRIFKSLKKNKLFGITFDTGNIFITDKNISKVLKENYKIVNHIHLKDRNNKNENVVFSTGEIDFDSFFRVLKKKKYNKLLTFETHRGINPLVTANLNLKRVKKIIKNII